MFKGFQKPKRLVANTETLTERYGMFTAQPFERGFGSTIGTGLRRVLLSSIEGAAITAVRIEGVAHEFSPIPGVVGDATDLIFNLLQVQDDVGGVFHHARNGAELVSHAFNTDGGDGRSFNGAQEHAAEAGADGGSKAPLERLGGKHAVTLGE